MCSFAAPTSPSPHPIVCTSVTRPVHPSPRQSVVQPVCPSSHRPPHSIYQPISQSHCPSVPWPVPPSSLSVHHCLTICTPSYHICQAVLSCLTVHPPTPVRQTVCLIHTVCMMHQSVCPHVHHEPTV